MIWYKKNSAMPKHLNCTDIKTTNGCDKQMVGESSSWGGGLKIMKSSSGWVFHPSFPITPIKFYPIRKEGRKGEVVELLLLLFLGNHTFFFIPDWIDAPYFTSLFHNQEHSSDALHPFQENKWNHSFYFSAPINGSG